MKKKIIYIAVVLILILGITLIIFINKKNNKSNAKSFYNITYVSSDNDACLTFYDASTYSLYDCDSEPTDYFFDSENECTYDYDGKYMTFDCKYYSQAISTDKIEVLKWDKQIFKFTYENKDLTFKAKKD